MPTASWYNDRHPIYGPPEVMRYLLLTSLSHSTSEHIPYNKLIIGARFHLVSPIFSDVWIAARSHTLSPEVRFV